MQNRSCSFESVTRKDTSGTSSLYDFMIMKIKKKENNLYKTVDKHTMRREFPVFTLFQFTNEIGAPT